MTQRAIFNGQEFDLPTALVNLVFNRTHGESQYPGRVVIDSATALQHYDMIDEICGAAVSMFRMIVTDFEGEVTKTVLDASQPCFRRLAGMLDLTVRLMLSRKQFVWKYPEDGLHPKYQGNIADVAVYLSGPTDLVLERLLFLGGA